MISFEKNFLLQQLMYKLSEKNETYITIIENTGPLSHTIFQKTLFEKAIFHF